MKHSLLLMLLFLSAACHNSNTTSTDPSARNMPFENSAYLTISHSEDQSILRRKLLNLALKDRLKEDHKEDKNAEIKIGDEFSFADDSFHSSSLNIEEYKTLKSSAAEVIVSYNDRLEIYFVPTGIERQKAFAQLGIAPETGATFLWVDSSDKFLTKDKVYYLISATKLNLNENDIHFNQRKILLNDYFNEKMFNFSRNQILELMVKVDYLQKETAYPLLRGQRVRCTHDMVEAGICYPCNYKIETPTGGFTKMRLENSDLVDLDIIINGRKYHLNELNPSRDASGNFRVLLDLKKILTTDIASFQIIQNSQYPVFKKVHAEEMSSGCEYKNVSNTIDITPTVKMNLELNVKGRTLNFSI